MMFEAGSDPIVVPVVLVSRTMLLSPDVGRANLMYGFVPLNSVPFQLEYR